MELVCHVGSQVPSRLIAQFFRQTIWGDTFFIEVTGQCLYVNCVYMACLYQMPLHPLGHFNAKTFPKGI